MNIEIFKESLSNEAPSPDLELALQALWWDGKGDWTRAHECAQADESDPRNAWVHAYLHRKEGDLSNAAYWYRRANQPVASRELDAEWHEIAKALIGSPTR